MAASKSLAENHEKLQLEVVNAIFCGIVSHMLGQNGHGTETGDAAEKGHGFIDGNRYNSSRFA
jgi:hypothetical protein